MMVAEVVVWLLCTVQQAVQQVEQRVVRMLLGRCHTLLLKGSAHRREQVQHLEECTLQRGLLVTYCKQVEQQQSSQSQLVCMLKGKQNFVAKSIIRYLKVNKHFIHRGHFLIQDSKGQASILLSQKVSTFKVLRHSPVFFHNFHNQHLMYADVVNSKHQEYDFYKHAIFLR